MKISNWPIATDRERELLEQVLQSPAWGGYHPLVEQFEHDFAAYHNTVHGISCANGTIALEMALEAANIGEGDEVIVPAISFIATATAVNRVGATPVFVDIEPLTFNIDPGAVESAVTARTRGVIAVHFGGPPADLDWLPQIADREGLTLIEDAAHAHGSEWRGRKAGSFGLASCFSFQNSKVMTAGEGGIVLTSNDAIAAKLRSLGNQGRLPGKGWFEHYTLATNYRISAFQAAVLTAQLERLEEQIELRTRNARRIMQATVDLPGLQWQRIPDAVNRSSWYLLLGRIDGASGISRDAFTRSLSEQGIPCTPFYPHTLYQNPAYKNGGCRVLPCPNAEAYIHDAFWLPHRALMGDAETTEAIAQAIADTLKGESLLIAGKG